MKVKLISHSQCDGKELLMSTSVTELVAYCARVSNPDNQMNDTTSAKLLKYLIKHKHWSPFEMVSVCLEIETTRDIARQILRHRSFSFQEFSQRYAHPEIGFELREARIQDPKNRQNSIETEDFKLIDEWNEKQSEVIEAAQEAYNWAINNGIAKEQVRAVLPEGNTLSRLYVNGTLRSWIHFCELRGGHGTQMEHQEVAWACAKVISKIFPFRIDYNAPEPINFYG